MTSFKTTAYIETTENQLKAVIDAILGKIYPPGSVIIPLGSRVRISSHWKETSARVKQPWVNYYVRPGAVKTKSVRPPTL